MLECIIGAFLVGILIAAALVGFMWFKRLD